MKKKIVTIIIAACMAASFAACNSKGTETVVQDEQVQFDAGVTVEASKESPTGYLAHFVLEADDEDIVAASVGGPFLYIDPSLEVTDSKNCFQPDEFKTGYYAASMSPGTKQFYNSIPMEYSESREAYILNMPITSGAFLYSYDITYADGRRESIADPASTAVGLANPNTDTQTDSVTRSIVFGRYDEEKQVGAPNLDYVLPKENGGQKIYVEYTGNLSDHQDLGIYLPAGYDAAREEPYKVVYASHGGGGNETDWFEAGMAGNIIDNLGLDCIVVTMNNSVYAASMEKTSSTNWDYLKIEDNVINYIIPYMEANYNVSKEAKDRAFCGLSMGSLTTMHMFFDHPEAFGYFGAFSGSDMSAVNSNNTMAATLFITCGTCDIASSKVMPNMDEARIKYEDFTEYIAQNPMPNVIDGGYIYGGHDWFTWCQSFKTFVSDICWK
ncbi:MAG: hypothetical protein K6B15_01945 [Parasporobacterium sp.]|nr:hypothetical protein [Parasporobacterium sp.]